VLPPSGTLIGDVLFDDRRGEFTGGDRGGTGLGCGGGEFLESLPGLERQLNGTANAVGLRGLAMGSDRCRELLETERTVRVHNAERQNMVGM
jgi:hypothetical protein